MKKRKTITQGESERIAAAMESLNAILVRLSEMLPPMHIEIAKLKARLDVLDGGEISERPN